MSRASNRIVAELRPDPDWIMPLLHDTDASRRRFGARASRRSMWRGLDQSSLMGMELLAAILTWAGIGWLGDRWLGTGPWLFGVGTMVGFAAGLYLIWLRSGREQERDAAGHAPGGGGRG